MVKKTKRDFYKNHTGKEVDWFVDFECFHVTAKTREEAERKAYTKLKEEGIKVSNIELEEFQEIEVK